MAKPLRSTVFSRGVDRGRRGPMLVQRPARWLLAAVSLPLLVLISGCSTIEYYWQGINGQLEIMRKATPIEQVIAGDGDKELRAKLERVVSIRDFASRELALPDNGSYRRYA